MLQKTSIPKPTTTKAIPGPTRRPSAPLTEFTLVCTEEVERVFVAVDSPVLALLDNRPLVEVGEEEWWELVVSEDPPPELPPWLHFPTVVEQV